MLSEAIFNTNGTILLIHTRGYHRDGQNSTVCMCDTAFLFYELPNDNRNIQVFKIRLSFYACSSCCLPNNSASNRHPSYLRTSIPDTDTRRSHAVSQGSRSLPDDIVVVARCHSGTSCVWGCKWCAGQHRGIRRCIQNVLRMGRADNRADTLDQRLVRAFILPLFRKVCLTLASNRMIWLGRGQMALDR